MSYSVLAVVTDSLLRKWWWWWDGNWNIRCDVFYVVN